jgi:hypothetical protein
LARVTPGAVTAIEGDQHFGAAARCRAAAIRAVASGSFRPRSASSDSVSGSDVVTGTARAFLRTAVVTGLARGGPCTLPHAV